MSAVGTCQVNYIHPLTHLKIKITLTLSYKTLLAKHQEVKILIEPALRAINCPYCHSFFTHSTASPEGTTNFPTIWIIQYRATYFFWCLSSAGIPTNKAI